MRCKTEARRERGEEKEDMKATTSSRITHKRSIKGHLADEIHQQQPIAASHHGNKGNAHKLREIILSRVNKEVYEKY